MRAVLDPNVLVSAAISPTGQPRQILTAWIEQRFELIASPALLDELADVLARPKFRRYITVAVATEFIDGPCSTTYSGSRIRRRTICDHRVAMMACQRSASLNSTLSPTSCS